MNRKRQPKGAKIPDVESPVVKPRGRPRKAKAEPVAAVQPAPAESSPEPGPVPKKRRGRHAKPGSYLDFFRPKNVALTEQLLADICDALEAGVARNKVRKIFEIPTGTWNTWHTTSKDQTAQDPLILAFYDRTQAAAEKGRLFALKCVRSAMPDDWRAAAWYLERSDPARWQPRNRQEHHHSGAINGRLTVDYSRKLPAPEAVQDRILQMAEGIAQRRGVPHLSIHRPDDEPQTIPMNGHSNGHHNGQNGNGHTNGSNGHH